MKFDHNVLILTSVIIAVLLNLILPLLIRPLIPERVLNVNHDDSNDTIIDSFVKMLVHHEKNKLSSSIVVAIIVALSVYLGLLIKIKPSTVSSVRNY